jgi:hypothetical protein
MASAAEGDDAELLALGAALDKLYLRHAEASAADWALVEEADRRMAPHLARYDLDRSVDLWELTKATWTEVGRDGREVHQITDAMDAPVDRVMQLPAHTVEGLAVKARAAAFYCSHFWEDDDFDKRIICSFVESFLALAGRSLPFVPDAEAGSEEEPEPDGQDYCAADFGACQGYSPEAKANFEDNLSLFTEAARAIFITMTWTKAKFVSVIQEARATKGVDGEGMEILFDHAERFASSFLESLKTAKRRYKAVADSVSQAAQRGQA